MSGSGPNAALSTSSSIMGDGTTEKKAVLMGRDPARLKLGGANKSEVLNMVGNSCARGPRLRANARYHTTLEPHGRRSGRRDACASKAGRPLWHLAAPVSCIRLPSARCRRYG